jgi:hypothetical protein
MTTLKQIGCGAIVRVHPAEVQIPLFPVIAGFGLNRFIGRMVQTLQLLFSGETYKNGRIVAMRKPPLWLPSAERRSAKADFLNYRLRWGSPIAVASNPSRIYEFDSKLLVSCSV